MDIEKISERFNEIAHKYDEQRKFFIPCFDDFYGTSISFLSECRNDFRSVLDLGAGTGLLTEYLYRQYPDADFTLVDISEQMLKVAKMRFENMNNIEYIISDYSKALPDKKFDLIASALSIHHMESESRESLYGMIYDKLETGGYLINLDQFNAGSDFINSRYNKWWYEFIKSSGITEKEFESLLKRRELDRENTIDETKSMLKKTGFAHTECIYSYMKFGVILAVK